MAAEHGGDTKVPTRDGLAPLLRSNVDWVDHRQGRTPKRASAAPSHLSNAPIKPESQSILSKIVAHWSRYLRC
jgi:hypothetical protein